MSQNNYKIRIIEILLNQESHIRAIARALHTNQTTISRKINELYKENIVDCKKEGKNKIFFLKKTWEAKQYVIIVESYKSAQIVNKYPCLRRIFEEIGKIKTVKIAILFGSYAKGTADKESDIDIYVDTAKKKIKQEIEQIDTKINTKIGRYNKDSLLIKEIEKNHIIIKGADEYYEKNKFFS